MQKGKHWLRKLSNTDRKRFSANLNKLRADKEWYLNREFRDLDEFVSSAFMWDMTNEGMNYWYTRSVGSAHLAKEIKQLEEQNRLEVSERLRFALVGENSSNDEDLLKQARKYLRKKVKIEIVEGKSFFVV